MSIQKKRHGCLTSWLVFMVLANSITSLVYLFARQVIKQAVPEIHDWAFFVLAIVGIFNIICTVALFNWKKWGFWGFLGSSVTTLVVNLSIGVGILQSFSGLIGIVILYGVLNIGETNKGWTQLE